MKTFFFSFLVCVFVLPFSATAQEDLGGFVIEDFHVDIGVNEDKTFDVKETIVVQFSEQRHGIFRNIPVRYKNRQGFNFRLKIDEVGVFDGAGNSRPFSKYRDGNDLVLKIGDAARLIGDEQVYIIKYKVRNGLRFFSDHSELFWNPIGTEWKTTIGKATATVDLFRGVTIDGDDAVCFTSFFGSRERDCSATVSSSSRIEFASNDVLDAGEGLTIAIRFPLTFIPRPTLLERIEMFFADNWGLGIPFAALFGMGFLWWAHGRELQLNKTTIVQYGPPKTNTGKTTSPKELTPGEVGYLLKEKYTTDFVAADIVNLAAKGFLKIKEINKSKLMQKVQKISSISNLLIPIIFFVVSFVMLFPLFFGSSDRSPADTIFTVLFIMFWAFITFVSRKGSKNLVKALRAKATDYELENLKDWRGDGQLTEHEKELMKGLFGVVGSDKKVTLSKLKNFYSHVNDAKKKIKKRMEELDYFEENVWNNKILYIVSGVLMIVGGIFLGAGAQRLDIFFGLIAGALVVFGFGYLMSKRTLLGAETLRHIGGLRQYVYTAERYRVKFQEEQNIFEKILPFAMVFGMADKWAAAFEGIYEKNPDWYNSTSKSFRPIAFADSLTNNFGAVASTAATPPRSPSSSSGFSSGGGFSGGGGGGGGGGSW